MPDLRDETYRAAVAARLPDDERATATVIVTRQGLGRSARTWVTLHGSIRATAVLTDDQVDELQTILNAARESRP